MFIFATMGVRSTVSGWFSNTREVYVGKADGNWAERLLPQMSATGVTITPQVAIGVSTVYACIQKIATTLAQLPIELYDGSGGSFDLIQDNRTYLWNVSPDENQTAFRFRETLYALMLLFGCGYAEIIRDRRSGDAIKLCYLQKSKLKELRDAEDNVVWEYKTKNGYRLINGRDVLRFEYLFAEGPAQTSKETVSILKAAQDYASKFFAGGGVMDGLLTSEGKLTPTQIDEFIDSWERQHGKQTRLLPLGIKYTRLGVEPDKAQNTTSREFQATQVCQIFNIDPRMIGINSASAYKSTQEASNHFAVHCITPLVNRLEGELNLKMLFRGERQRLYFRHNLDELVRGDIETRFKAYDIGLKSGFLNRDEVRAKERRNKISEGGDIYTVQVNQIALDKMQEYSEKIAQAGDAGDNAGNNLDNE